MAKELIVNGIKYTGGYINGELSYWQVSKNIANLETALQIPAMLIMISPSKDCCLKRRFNAR